MDNLEKLATYGTQNEEKPNKKKPTQCACSFTWHSRRLVLLHIKKFPVRRIALMIDVVSVIFIS